MIRILTLSSTLLLLGLPRASAIINITDPLGNTAAPTGLGGEPTDPGFDYVGKVNGSTGVYIGDGWVLTADHVGAGTFNLDGTNYSYNGIDSHQIGGADLRLFKLSTNPLLAPLSISTTSPTISDDVVMIGAGRSPSSATPTTWHVDTDPDPWVWSTSTFTEADTTIDGFTTTSTKTKRWGTNVIEDTTSTLSYLSYTDMSAIITDFDQVGGTAYESQAVTNDSGSGLFIDNGSGWELAGTIVTVGLHSGQPGGNGGANNALFGNETYALDLSVYADEIYGLIPEPRRAAFLLGYLALSAALIRRRKKSSDAQS
ncbi:MAG: hypothetical protein ACSHX8_11510 [Opitutaceae bacterium]